MRATTTALMLLFFVTTYSQVKFKVRENSLIGKVAARLHGTDQYAVTVGKTIYISCPAEDFFERTGWVYHELTHIYQYKKLGTLEFLKRYMFYWIIFLKHDLIPLEMEANYYEDNLIIPKGFVI